MTGARLGGRLEHVPALDGLRGVAIALVLAFHLGVLRAGFIGVDLFFVLSGFLITRLLVDEHTRRDRVALLAFWGRRARRLLPALLLLLLGIGAYAAFLASPESRERIRYDALGTLAYVANWRAIAIGADYWQMFASRSPLEHVWSLAIEEQFYLVWPLVVVVVLRKAKSRPRALAYVAGALACASAAAMLALYDPTRSTTRVYYGSDTRAFALAIGGALGAWWSARDVAPRTNDVLAFASAALLAIASLTLDGASALLYRGGLVVVALASAVTIAAAARGSEGAFARALSFAPLRWLGTISYGVYLWHWPIFIVAGSWLGAGWRAQVVAVGATIAIASLSYAVVERPIRTGRLTRRALAFVAPAAVACTVVVVFVATAGSKTPRPSIGLAREPEPEHELDESRGATPSTVLIVGDSVARSLDVPNAPGARTRFVDRGIDGCGLRRGSARIRFPDGKITGRDDCGDWAARWTADLDEVKPDVVMLVLLALTIGDVELDGHWVHPCESAFDEPYLAAMDRAIDVLSSRGAAVLVATAPYVDDPTEGFIAPGSGMVQDFATNRRRTDCVNAIVRTAVRRRPRSEWIDLGARLCPTRACVHREGDVELRPDGTHFSPEGARVVRRFFEEELARLPIAELRAR